MRVLILPGYADSGPEHWQTLWERARGYPRVVQDDWLQPTRDAWVARLEETLAVSDEPTVLVAHSLGCILVAHWAASSPHVARIAGALLVAPPDVDEAAFYMPEIESFAPVPLVHLPFRSIVVSSRNDPYADPARARAFADAWGARHVDLGEVGHINAESNLGDWPLGLTLLEELLAPAGA